MNSRLFLLSLGLPLVAGVLVAPAAVAQQTSPGDTARLIRVPEVTILGGEQNELFTSIPGSVSKVSAKELRLLAPVSSNEVFRRVPGLNVVDEEGIGLRANIGIRGMDPDRSRTVLVLEDGVPVALGPYGEPELYYTPVIDRMAGVEVLKGSGQIQYGPQTIGGVINYITADAPAEAQTTVRLRGGGRGYFSGLASYGNTFGRTGLLVSYLHKRADNLGPVHFRLHDLTMKLNVQLNDRQTLRLKLGVYDEFSNASYLGLTQSQYEQGGQDYQQLAPDDRLPVRRYSISAAHTVRLSDHVQLATTAFGYTTVRNWQRQDFSLSPTASNQTGVVWGDPTVRDGAVYMQNSNGHRNRQFQVAGLEPRLAINYAVGGRSGELATGVRVLHEQAEEQYVVGKKANARGGDQRDYEIRTGLAFSAFAQNKLQLSERLSATVGLRGEVFNYERDIRRGLFTVNNRPNQIRDTMVVATSSVTALIPGAGLNYTLNERATVFAGVHRGFAPPRIKDAISGTGVALQLDAELSWNYEVGTRARPLPGLETEVTGFLMDFSNQIIPVSLSSGNAGAGFLNGGNTRHIGAEGSVVLDFARLLTLKQSLALDLKATYVKATYTDDRFATTPTNESRNIKGHQTPYAPNVLLSGGFSVEPVRRLSVRLTGTYVSSQYSDELNTVEAAPHGRTGRIPGYRLLDATLLYRLPGNHVSISLAGKNLTDERYIASRRPQGIRVSTPRLLTAGLDVTL
ncbi:TonB-dependent receptor (plasmid) [Hymenobacter tibetensis]|uniref:TonB-dependent receptor n=1 Tax=Hymenobacter tibetensis TaxID=497967 RepID=A0ABY4DBY3_9BACT|nr:TonB-dependent receptor [Hymenobacter tibetensis]UOG77588.1 TonB-dependent receptor [Hymenobacter tibetensis]